MEFDLRAEDVIFKHSISQRPDLSEERYREHFHTNFELLYFVSGDAQFMLNHTLYNIKPGSLLLAKPGEYHNIIFCSVKPYERYVCRFQEKNLAPEILKALLHAQSVYFIAGTVISQEFRHMDRHAAQLPKQLQFNACMGSLHILLSYLISAEQLTQNADYTDEECRKILIYIAQHLSEIQTVQNLSDALHMSKSMLYHVFQKQLHIPIMSYIRTQKCLRAKALMEQGMSAAQAAEQMGFQHYSSFWRDYQKVFHESPGTLSRAKAGLPYIV